MIDHISVEKWSKIDLQIFGGHSAWIACNGLDSTGRPACIDSMYGFTYSCTAGSPDPGRWVWLASAVAYAFDL